MKRACEHCGIDFLPVKAETVFCCQGCSAVAALLVREGLQDFYRRRDAPGRPVGELPRVDSARAAALQAEAEAETDSESGDRVSLRLGVEGMTCAGCAWLIEHLFERHAGGSRISVSLSGGSMDLIWEPGVFDLLEFFKTLAEHGYAVKTYRSSWTRRIPTPVIYFLLSFLFALNTSLLAWLRAKSGEEIGFIKPPIDGLLDLLLVLSAFAVGAFLWMLIRSLRVFQKQN
jgi:Cu2+-exporting ATPase